MSYVDRKRFDDPRPIVHSPASRWSFLGIALCLLATPLAQTAKAHGWVADKDFVVIGLGVLGLGCIFGAWIAHRAAQKRVARDFAGNGEVG